MKLIENMRFPNERDLYASENLLLKNCAFDGEEDGESALKESRNIALEDCTMNLRYPLWHDENAELTRVEMTQACRAALWYSQNVTVRESKLSGIKCLRECERARLFDSAIASPEFGWKCRDVALERCSLVSEYAFLEAEDLRLRDVKFSGKYSFQYVRGAVLENCELDTKDAFWHAKDITVKNCVVKGEYLGWYSENLTFVNCTIIGTQPLCYCKGLKLVGCKTEGCDLAFEYSEVEAEILGDILSVKNPRAGRITAESIGEVIYTEDSKFPCACEVRLVDKPRRAC